MIKLIKKHRTLFIVAGLFLLALFLRVYRLPEFIAYHQDQVRDLLYVKDHFEAGKFIYLGPKASVGNFYLAPLWYYLMEVAYFFSHSPVAPALLVALLNSAAVVLLYFFAANFLGISTAVLASLLYAVSPFSIEYSRFAWNPNPIPFFTILAIYSLYIYIYKNRNNFFYLAVVSANFAFQLHYQGFLLVAAVFLVPLIKKDWKRLFISSILFILLLTPFLIYEMSNGYPNQSQIASFLGRTTSGRSLGIANSFRAFTLDYPEFISRVLFFGYKPLGLVFSLVTYFMVIKNLLAKKIKGKWTPVENIHLIFSILLLTLFAYRQWIVPYYLLVALIPLIIIIVLAFGRFKWLLMLLVFANLVMSPAFSKTDSSLLFFEKSVTQIEKSDISKNCLEYRIDDPDLKFATHAVDYLVDYRGYSYPEPKVCGKKLVFCQNALCDKIKGVKKLESDFLGLSLIER
jgi:4-amino-4-deoxy-L-arabinose transferase-like glycosyltransferase